MQVPQTLEARLFRMEAALQIQQLMYRYVHNMALFRADKVAELFAPRDDSSIEISSDGVCRGIEAIRAFYERTRSLGEAKGTMIEHYMLCPVVEVAADGMTARASAFSPGIVSIASARAQGWNWGKYFAAFIKEEHEWKIWHLHWYQMFECSYEKGWLYEQHGHAAAELAGGLPPSGANRASTYHKPYDPKAINYFLPEPPEPYETWSE